MYYLVKIGFLVFCSSKFGGKTKGAILVWNNCISPLFEFVNNLVEKSFPGSPSKPKRNRPLYFR